MQEQLEYVVVKLCENLPLDITLFERKGLCDKPTEHCEYCRKNGKKDYFCYKKTYTLDHNPRKFKMFKDKELKMVEKTITAPFPSLL